MADMYHTACYTARGKHLSTADVGALGSPQLSSSPKTTTFTQLTPTPNSAPHAYRPRIPRSPSRGRDGGAFTGQLPVECRKQFDMGIRQHGE